MNYKSKLFLLGLVSKIFAAKFSVVSFDGACKLNVGGTNYPMTADPQIPNLYTATADVSPGSKYNYICGTVNDPERTLSGETTHNELIGRPSTVTEMHEFGYPSAEPWKRSIGRTELFDPTYVPIVIMDGDKNFFVNGKGSTTLSKISFILKDNTFTFTNIPTTAKNYEEDKFQIRVELPYDGKKDIGIYHRNVLKFRPSSNDPVFFRQILYSDIAHAIGNPAHESVAARVYLADGTPVGLYVLQEDCTTESFIRTAFFGNPDGTIKDYTPSVIYDCATNADFNYYDENWLGAFKNNTPDMKIELKEMTRQIDILDVQNVDSVKNVDDNWLDLDTLYRALALEYLGGHWDSFWFMTTNFVTYHPFDEAEGEQYNLSKYKYYFIDQDFDQTFGIGLKPELESIPTKSYSQFVNLPAQFWQDLNKFGDGSLNDNGSRVLLNKLLGCDGQPTCETKKLFENHLKSIVQHIFNPVAIDAKIKSYRARYDDEMQWDTSIQRIHTGTERQFAFTYQTYIDGIERGVSSPFGVRDWVQKITTTVCNEFNIKYDEAALTPETASKMKVEAINPGTEYDASANVFTGGAIANNVNVILATIASLLCVVLFL